MAKESLNKIKVKNFSVIVEKLEENGLLYRCDFSQLAKHFLLNFLDINKIFQADFTVIRDKYLENIEFESMKKEVNKECDSFMDEIQRKRIQDIENACRSESDFYKFICKEYLHLNNEPKDELLTAYTEARKDIIEIDNNIENIQNLIETIKKNNVTIEKQEKIPILEYYKKHNEQAKEDVYDFLKNKIEKYALYRSYENSLSSGFLRIANNLKYQYSWKRKAYKPHYPDDLINKFGELLVPEYRSLSEIYHNNKKEFRNYLTKYISDNQIIQSIKDLLYRHYILNIREDIVLEALNIYQNGAKIMFANAIPTIIEGIFHDLCILIGEDDNQLLNNGFQYKLEKLKNILGHEMCYEYYAFRFRLFRNKVAHGRMTKTDVEKMSDLLLLDLYHICKLVFSSKIELNKKLSLIEKINNNSTSPEYNDILKYILLDKIKIPSFYNLTDKLSVIDNIINSDVFWNFINEEFKKEDEITKHGIFSIVQILKKQKNLNTQCTSFFKNANIKKKDTALVEKYYKLLTKSAI
jgi:hypothetical protein